MPHLTSQDMLHLALSLVALLWLARLFTAMSGKISAPPVLAEIFLGILIGPTLLGTLAPEASAWLFPVTGETGSAMKQLSHLGVILLLFVAGMETDLKALRTESGKVFATAMGSSLLPFTAGFFLVTGAPALFGITQAFGHQHLLLAGFLGIALAISALPVIIRILMDLGLYQSRTGIITVASASVMDIVGWTAFTVLLFCMKPFSLSEGLGMLWSHATLPAFIAGVIAGNAFHHEKAKRWIYTFVVSFVSPIFFLSVGAKINFIASFDAALIAAIILVATFSKVTGSFLGASQAGLKGKEALAVGFALNVRGAMEIILAKQAFEAGLIQANLYVALVIMALFTSMLSAPALRILLQTPARKTPLLPELARAA